MDKFGFKMGSFKSSFSDVQEKLGTFADKSEDVANKLKQDGGLDVPQVPEFNGVQNVGYSTDMEEGSSGDKSRTSSFGNQSTISDEGQSRVESGVDSGIETSLTDVRPATIPSDVKKKYSPAESEVSDTPCDVDLDASIHREEVHGPSLDVSMSNSEASTTFYQESVQSETNGVKNMRRKSSPAGFLIPMTGSLRGTGQVNYFLVKNRKSSKPKKIRRTNSAFINVNERYPRDSFHVLSPNRLVIDASSPRSCVTTPNGSLSRRGHSLRIVSGNSLRRFSTSEIIDDKYIGAQMTSENLKRFFQSQPATNGDAANTSISDINCDVNNSLNSNGFLDGNRARSIKMQQAVMKGSISEQSHNVRDRQMKSSITNPKLRHAGVIRSDILESSTICAVIAPDTQNQRIPGVGGITEFKGQPKTDIGKTKNSIKTKNLANNALTHKIPFAGHAKKLKKAPPRPGIENMKSKLNTEKSPRTTDADALNKQLRALGGGLAETGLDTKCADAQVKLTAYKSTYGTVGTMGMFGKSTDKSDALIDIVDESSNDNHRAGVNKLMDAELESIQSEPTKRLTSFKDNFCARSVSGKSTDKTHIQQKTLNKPFGEDGLASENGLLDSGLDVRNTKAKLNPTSSKGKFQMLGKSEDKTDSETTALNKPSWTTDQSDGSAVLDSGRDYKRPETRKTTTSSTDTVRNIGNSKDKSLSQKEALDKSSVDDDSADIGGWSDSDPDTQRADAKEKLTASQGTHDSFKNCGNSEDKTKSQKEALDTISGADALDDNNGWSDTDPDAKRTEAKEKLTASKTTLSSFGKFGKSTDKPEDQSVAKEETSKGGGYMGDNDMSGIKGKFGGISLPFGDKEGKGEYEDPKDKALDKLEKGIFGSNNGEALAPYRYTIGIIVRLTLIFVNAMTIVQTVIVTGNHWNWGCAPVCSIFIALEYTRVVFKRTGKEWTWWVPCLLVYLLTTLPLIWQLQINNISTENGEPSSTDIWTIIVSDATVYLTVLARWLLQGGIVTFGTLAAVIMDFFANASDIMDILAMTDQPEIRASIMLMYWVLGAWSASFIKFIPLIDLDGKSKDPKRLPKVILTNFGPMFTEAIQTLFTLVFLDMSFLIIRIYLLVFEGVVSFSLLFFVIKNLLAFGVQLRKLITVCKTMPCFQKKSKAEEKEELNCV